jgi:hypothetical protein
MTKELLRDELQRKLIDLLEQEELAPKEARSSADLFFKYLDQGQPLEIQEMGVVSHQPTGKDIYQIVSSNPYDSLVSRSGRPLPYQRMPDILQVLQRLELQEDGYSKEFAALAIQP